MSATTRLTFGDLSVEGRSVAGVETWFRVHPPGLAFDAGRGAVQLEGSSDLFLSHGHLDHALGVPYLLSQRTWNRGRSARVFCPQATREPLERLVRAAADLEGVTYDFELVGLDPGQRVELSKEIVVEAFETDHVVPSLGFHLIRRRHRLLPQYRGVQSTEIAKLVRQGTQVEEVVEDLALSYCGDTGSKVFELEPRILTSRVLMIECTFLADNRRVESARYKHIHLDDLIANADRFGNEAILLHHLSRRHTVDQLREAVDRCLPQLADRIHLLGEHSKLKFDQSAERPDGSAKRVERADRADREDHADEPEEKES